MIKKFKRKTVTPNKLEAIQFQDTADSFAEIRRWVGKRFHYDYQESPFVFLESKSLQRRVSVEKGNWIVKDEQGNFEVYASVHLEEFEEVTE